MRILLVARYKPQYEKQLLPFVTEQGEAIRKLGNEVDYFPIKGNGLVSYFRAKKDLLSKIDEFQPDIVHAHYGLSGITAVLQHKVPVVTTFHNGETLTFAGNLLSSLFSLRTQYMIYVAEHIYKKSYFKKKGDYSIIPCGINLSDCTIISQREAREKMHLREDKKYILFGGGFDNLRKNYPLLKDAISRLNRNDVEVLEMKGLSRKEITLLMCACDVFALPSKSEGSPQALKEAMACNCPIVATDIADIKYLLGDLPGHYICNFNPDNVAEKVQLALNFNSRTKGRERIQELGLDNAQVAQKIVDIYHKVLNKK